MQKCKKYFGFTLVELMVVMAIAGIMATIGWATLGDSSKNINASNACDQLASSINKARGYALSGKSSTSILISGSANSYTISGISNPETISLPKGVSVNAFSCSFAVPSGAMSGCGTISFVGTTKTVTVEAFNAKCN